MPDRRSAPTGRYVDRSVLVVGGSTGIGLATARRLAAEGASVVLADVDEAAAAAAADALPGGPHRSVRADVTSRTSVDAAVATLVGLDVLVHVAGGERPRAPFLEAGDEVWTELLELNLLGFVRTCRTAGPLLLASERGPAVVVVSSVNAVVALGGLELGPAVRVNAVVPGTIRTRVWDEQRGGADRLVPLYPLARVGEPSDVAGAVAFLASDDAAWVTGHALPVDGGLLTGGALRRLIG